jgi:hypothetical protein
MKPRHPSKTLALCRCLWNRLAGLWMGLIVSALLWLAGTHEAVTGGKNLSEVIAAQRADDGLAFQPMHLIPLLLSGLLLDAGRWRMRQRLNRARHEAFHQITRHRVEDQARLVQDLLTLRRLAMQEPSLNEPSQRLLDGLIVAHHRHLSNLQRGASDSDLMAPLLTGAYADDLGKTTWSAPLQRVPIERDHRR